MSSTALNADAEGRITPLDRVVGTILVVCGVLNVVAARSTVFVLPALVVVAIGLMLIERRSIRDYLQLPGSSLPVAAFLCLGVVSAAWSADSLATLTFAASILGVFLQWHIVNRWVWTQPDYRIRHFAYWLAIAVMIGTTILLCEVYGQQILRRMLIDNFGILMPPAPGKHWQLDAMGHAHIHEYELNRSVAVANLLLWPALLCALSWWRGRKFAIIATALCASVFLATMGSNHETSKLAVIIGLICFFVAVFRLRLARLISAACWVLMLVAVPYAAHVAYTDYALHKASWLQYSARERIVIWSEIANLVPEAPVVGVGARTAYVLSNRNKEILEPPTKAQARTVARHAHNVYLQTWFELGAVGATVLLVAGLILLRAIARLRADVQPYALATFAVFAVEIASTWEIWQRWYSALFALTAIYLALGIRSMGPAPASGQPTARAALGRDLRP